MKPKYLPLMLLVTTSYLAGCSVTPKYQPPNVQAITGSEFTRKPSSQNIAVTNEQMIGRPKLLQWWKQFQDPVLNDLIDHAIVNNSDVRIAAANILESEALAKAATGRRWPEIAANTSADRSFTGSSTGSSFSAGSNRLYTTTYQVGASVTWQTDLFGRLRSNAKAAWADWQATQIDHIAVMHSVIADVIRQRVAVAIANQRLKIATDILHSRQHTLDIVTGRYQRGVSNSSAVDVRLARENVFSSTANITALEQNLVLAQHAMDVLTGSKPGGEIISIQDLVALAELDMNLIGIPAQMLDQRPDLIASEFRIIAQNERVGVAIANLYPDLTISLGGGWRDAVTSGLFSSNSLFASATGALMQTVFAGGALQAEKEAAKARLSAQAETYAGKVLIAMREVEDALIANQKLRVRLAQVEEQLSEARIAEQLSRDRYARGVETLLTVLETERRRQNAEDTRLQVLQNYWNARINLHLAIGGHWIPTNNYNAGHYSRSTK